MSAETVTNLVMKMPLRGVKLLLGALMAVVVTVAVVDVDVVVVAAVVVVVVVEEEVVVTRIRLQPIPKRNHPAKASLILGPNPVLKELPNIGAAPAVCGAIMALIPTRTMNKLMLLVRPTTRLKKRRRKNSLKLLVSFELASILLSSGLFNRASLVGSFDYERRSPVPSDV